MTREKAKQLLPIIQAYAEGKTIEDQSRNGNWNVAPERANIGFNEGPERYRIKPEPEPKYRPFESREECWAEMLKHQPFAWVHRYNEEPLNVAEVCGNYKANGFYGYHHIEWVYRTSIFIDGQEFFFPLENPNRKDMSDCMDYYEFADGTPFGVKVEED